MDDSAVRGRPGHIEACVEGAGNMPVADSAVPDRPGAPPPAPSGSPDGQRGPTVAVGRPPRRRLAVRGHPPGRYDHSREDLAALVGDEPPYRVRQIWDGLHRRMADIGEMTDLPAALRSELTERLPWSLTEVARRTTDDGGTVKLLFSLPDGHRIETVLMHYPDRTTVCVSTQAGCAMACGFCATGQAGFARHLTVGEIVEQVVRAARLVRATHRRRVSNVVFMGMGEPLANYDATVAALRRLTGDMGLSARRIVVSTVGIAPAIVRLAAEGLPVGLAVSLHAADDALRDELVPVNRRYPIATLVEACETWLRRTRRRVSLEWACIAGVNDTEAQMEGLARLARRLRAHVNLIPLNPTPGWPTPGTPPRRVAELARSLRRRGVNVTVRDTRGADIDGACGQLRAAAG